MRHDPASRCHFPPLSKSSCPMLCMFTAKPDSLEPLLRVYEGCALGVSGRGRGGEPDQAAPAFGEGLVPGLSRLRDRPAPGLAPQHQALAPDAGARLLRLRDEHQPPILHRKETFLPPGHPLVAKFVPTDLLESVGIGTRSFDCDLPFDRYIPAPLERPTRRLGSLPAMLKGLIEPRRSR